MFKHHGYLRRVLFGWIAIVLLSMMTGIATGERWQVISDIPTPRHSFSVAAVEGKIYLIGGTLFENENGPLGFHSWRCMTREPTPGSELRICQRFARVLRRLSLMEKSML